MLRSDHLSPVLLQVPRDLEDYEVDEHPYTPVKGWRPQGDLQDVQKAIHVLLHSKNPMIIAGQGIFGDACQGLGDSRS